MYDPTNPHPNEAAKVRFELMPYIGTSCLDLGCGASKVFPFFIGVDSGKDTQLFGTQMKPDLAGDVSKLGLFNADFFDTVFSSHTLEHIDDTAATLREWFRVVKVGGVLALYLPHRDYYPHMGEAHSNPDHKHDFAPDDIISIMREIAPDWRLEENQTRTGPHEYSFFQVFRKLPAGAGQHDVTANPKPEKTVGIVRPGAYGDAIWGSSLAAAFKADGYFVTMYTGPHGEAALRHDPDIDRIVRLEGYWLDDPDWVLYYLRESYKHSRFVNLIGSAESMLLPHPHEIPYYWPESVRRKRMNRNYLEFMYETAELSTDKIYPQRFVPNADEAKWAKEQRQKLFPGRMVAVAPTGSGEPKTWPHLQRFMHLMATEKVHCVVLGDMRQDVTPPRDWGHVIGTDLPIRLAMALAREADAVVGTETGILNAVANEPMLKVVALSHSSATGLCKHWTNTVALEPAGVKCHPCHRLHRSFEFCTRDTNTGWAACQAAVSAELVSGIVLDYWKSHTVKVA